MKDRIFTGCYYRGEKVYSNDYFIHYNGYHIISYSIIIDHGEFKANGKYVNAANRVRRVTKKPLSLLLDRVRHGRHILIKCDAKTIDIFFNKLYDMGIDPFSQGDIDTNKSIDIRNKCKGVLLNFLGNGTDEKHNYAYIDSIRLWELK